jgi:hypothetical protein
LLAGSVPEGVLERWRRQQRSADLRAEQPSPE